MRRSRRNRRNENPMIEAIKYYQRSVVKGLAIVLLPISLLGVAFALFINTPTGHEFMGWAEQDRQDEKVLESLEKDSQKQLDEFTESTNEDVQNTINEIEGTQDTTGTEYYSDDVYTAPETQGSVEQPAQEMNDANNNVSETQESQQVEKKTSKESTDIQKDNRPEPVQDEWKKATGAGVEYDEEGNPLPKEE